MSAGPGGPGPARLRRLGAPGPATQAVLAGAARPAARHGRRQPRRATAMAGPEAVRIRLFGEVAGRRRRDIPDPYGGGAADFDHVLDLLSAAAPVIVDAGPAARSARRRRESGRASRIALLTGLAVREARVVGSQHGYQHLMLTLAGGRRAFAKAVPAPPASQPGSPRRVRGRGERPALAGRGERRPGARGAGRRPGRAGHLDDPARPGDSGGRLQFGADLARLHGAGADGFGAPWPGFIASLPLDNTPRADWPQWYARAGCCPT